MQKYKFPKMRHYVGFLQMRQGRRKEKSTYTAMGHAWFKPYASVVTVVENDRIVCTQHAKHALTRGVWGHAPQENFEN